MDGKDSLDVAFKEDGADTLVNTEYLPPFTHGKDRWLSAGFVEEADRDLNPKEKIYLFVVEKTSGKIVDRHYWWPYSEQGAPAKDWPKYFVTTLKSVWDSTRKIVMGEPRADNADAPTVPTQTNFRSELPQDKTKIWYKGEENRAFHTLLNKDNWVKYLTFNKQSLPADATIEVRILDRTSKAQFGSFSFKPEPDRLEAAQWHLDLCTFINNNNVYIKAGGQDANGRINLNLPGAIVWIPRNAEFSIEVTSTGTLAKAGTPDPSADVKTEAPSQFPPFKLAAGLIAAGDTRLPDMTGFENDVIGSPENCWLSPYYLLADRDLRVDEVLHAWLIRQADGEPLEHVEFKADANNRSATQWPQAFAKQLKQSARHIRAGGWTEDGEFTELEGSTTSQAFAKMGLVEKSRINQLWHYSRNNRVISTAAFRTNWVQALTLGEISLTADTTLWVQVRDITSQYLYETHIFRASAGRLTYKQWTRDLCEQINKDGKMLRGGRLNGTSGNIEPDETNNALWIPQCSDLAVTLMPVTWWTQQSVTAERDLTEDESIYTYVLHDFPNAEPVAPHCFKPANAEDRKKEKWVSAWAKSLSASSLKPYVRLAGKGNVSAAVPADAVQASIWQVGAPLRVCTTEPSESNWIVKEFRIEQTTGGAKSTQLLSIIDEISGKIIYQLHCNPYSLNTKFSDPWPTKIMGSLTDQFSSSPFPLISVNTTPIKNNAEGIAPDSSGTIRISVPVAARVRASLMTSEEITDEEQTAFQVIEELRKENKFTVSAPAQKLITSRMTHYLNIPDTPNISTMYSYECAARLESALLSRKNRKAEKAAIPGVIKFSITTYKLENTSTAPDTTSPYYTPHTPTTIETLIEQEILTHGDILFLDSLNESEKFDLSILLQNATATRVTSPLHVRDRSSMLEYIYGRVHCRNLDPDYIFPAIFRQLARIKKPQYLWIEHQLAHNDSAYLPSTEFKVDHPTPSASSITYSRNSATTTLALRLSPSARIDGVRVLSSRPDREPSSLYTAGGDIFEETHWKWVERFCQRLELYAPQDFVSSPAPTVFIGTTNTSNIWESGPSTAYLFPPNDDGPTPMSPLCEDYGNTYRSEVFDITGQNYTGVDPRTGLFNAHYSLGVLAGVKGNGPVCDLTLHYSPLRANEAGLGDGWAFNFSSYASRQRTLTLSTGQTVQLTSDDVKNLMKGDTLEKTVGLITGKADTSLKQLSSLEITFRTGAKELLSRPTEDQDEHNSDLVRAAIDAFKEAKSQIDIHKQKSEPVDNQSWYDKALYFLAVGPLMVARGAAMLTPANDQLQSAIDSVDPEKLRRADWEARYLKPWKDHWKDKQPELEKEFDREIAYWESPDLQLLPSTLSSPSGGALTLKWTRRKGQYLLTEVLGVGDVTLLKGLYEIPTPMDGSADIISNATFTFWPNSNDAYRVTLHLKNYLLKSIIRSAVGDDVFERFDYRYSPDPTLDRVLTCIEESDGSVEKVVYEAEGMIFPKKSTLEKPALPRVVSHTISPGPHQPPRSTDWQYSHNNYLGYSEYGDYSHLEDSAVKRGSSYLYSSTSIEEHGLTTRRTWNGLHLQVEEQQTTPSGARTTVAWEFSDVPQGDPRFGLTTKTTTTYEDGVHPTDTESAS